jgi:hypothetical protein
MEGEPEGGVGMCERGHGMRIVPFSSFPTSSIPVQQALLDISQTSRTTLVCLSAAWRTF